MLCQCVQEALSEDIGYEAQEAGVMYRLCSVAIRAPASSFLGRPPRTPPWRARTRGRRGGGAHSR